MKIEDFGREAKLFILENDNGLRLSVTNFGARIVKIEVPAEQDGGYRNVSLACTSAEEYLEMDTYVGASIVPVAGRISGARVEISGKEYALTENEPGRTLHGGVNTANLRNWEWECNGKDEVLFTTVLEDGFNGFPGRIEVGVRYYLSASNDVHVDYVARSDKDTIFNPTNHVYFNLSGQFFESIGQHQLKIAADYYVPLGEDNLPLGEFAAVDGTPFDFREFALFETGFSSDHEQTNLVKGYDHPWKLSQQEAAVEVWSPDRKVGLEVSTDQPAAVIYTYNFPQEKLAAYHGVFSMECQGFPNACNLEGFGSIFLAAGEEFSSQTRYRLKW
ncbi:TPA: galactose mutarotase [Streptococcus suis]|nr:galactose mutarotase [Streptococcus suis]